MVLNRVNNTDPVVQVRLRVMQGNLYGTLQKVYLAAGFVYPFALNIHKKEGSCKTNQRVNESHHQSGRSGIPDTA